MVWSRESSDETDCYGHDFSYNLHTVFRHDDDFAAGKCRAEVRLVQFDVPTRLAASDFLMLLARESLAALFGYGHDHSRCRRCHLDVVTVRNG